MDLNTLIAKGQQSNRGRWFMNQALWRVIPFNKPHRLRIEEITDTTVKVFIPYKRNNQNHLKGLHACLMATAAEYSSGLLLLHRLGAKTYRLIMKSLEMEYFYQGKMEAYAIFTVEDGWIESNITEPLKTEDAILVQCEIRVEDKEGNHLATGRTNWQLKKWDKVKTKV